MKNVGASSLYDLWYLVKALGRIVLRRQVSLKRQLAHVVKHLKRLEKLIMANQEDLLAQVEADKLELLAASDAEKEQVGLVLAEVVALSAKVKELEDVIAAGGDTQPAIDAVKKSTAEIKARIEGIKE